jgi:hypothetical protein
MSTKVKPNIGPGQFLNGCILSANFPFHQKQFWMFAFSVPATSIDDKAIIHNQIRLAIGDSHAMLQEES